jgi:hypothetical protein
MDEEADGRGDERRDCCLLFGVLWRDVTRGMSIGSE